MGSWDLLGWTFNPLELIGFFGAALMIATLAMRTMVPLRVVGIASNVVQIIYGILLGVWPVLMQHLILLPLNVYRLIEQLRLVKKLRIAGDGDLSMDWLLPFMTRRRVAAGEVLFRKGDRADEMFIVTSGKLRLVEIATDVVSGTVVGELGLLAPNRRRTQTLECVEDAEIMQIDYERIEKLYFQNPSFGFYFLKLTSARLFQNIAKLETSLEARDQEIRQLRAQLAASAAPGSSA